MTTTPESIKFIDSLKDSTTPKWLNLKQLIAYLDDALPEAQLYGVIQLKTTGTASPITLTVLSYAEVIKNAEIVDLTLRCVSMQQDGTHSEPFDINASYLLPKPIKKPADVTKVNYLSFIPFSRVFISIEDRDAYFEEISWLLDMVDELAVQENGRKMSMFLRFLNGGGRPQL